MWAEAPWWQIISLLLAWTGKKVRVTLLSQACCVAMPRKAEQGGEDEHWVSSTKHLRARLQVTFF